MKQLHYGLIILGLVLCLATPAGAQVNIGIGVGLPHVSIGINLPLFPELVRVPGYPVYYAPQLDANYFFYDGMYWVYHGDNWYASSWYNGPWWLVEPEAVPLFILRIPVRYYRQPPPYFRGWRATAPPRWGQHWGHEWQQRRRGWDSWRRSAAPAPAPLPHYQRQYTGDRYPRVEQQQQLRRQSYRYQPRDTAVRRHFQQQGELRAPAAARQGRQDAPAPQMPRKPETQGPERRQQAPARLRGPAVQEQQPQPGGGQREQLDQRPQQQEQRAPEQRRGRGQEQRPNEERGRER